jgi:hypothetical protein
MNSYRVLEGKMYNEKLEDHFLLAFGTLLRLYSIQNTHKTRVSDS